MSAAPDRPASSPAGDRGVRVALGVIAVILAVAALVAARGLWIPVLLAGLGALVLAPAVRALVGFGLPRALAAVAMLGIAVTALFGLALALAEPAQVWLERAPHAARKLEQVLDAAHRPLAAASAATESLIGLSDGAGAKPARVALAEPGGWLGRWLREAPALAASAFATLFLTLLLLAHADAELRKLVALLPGLSAKKGLVGSLRDVQRELSRYLLTITVINGGLGAATAAVLWSLGLPDPLLWGGLAALLNFAPYVGPAIAAALLLLAGAAHYPQPLEGLLPPALFLGLHAVEGQLVTPLLLGRRLALDPVVIFLALMLFGWMWGIAGLLVAVPLLTCLKIAAQRMAPGSPAVRLLLH